MLIVSASMPRSGSLWYINLTKDLLVSAGCKDPDMRRLREKLGLKLPNKSGRLRSWTALRLYKIAQDFTFPVKTHASPSFLLRHLLRKSKVKATYLYRDPRDVIVSALELGAKLREGNNSGRYFYIGPYRSFARLKTLSGAINWVNWQLFPRWKKWMNCPNVLFTRYEDLVRDTRAELKRLASYLGIETTSNDLEKIIAKYMPDSTGKIKGDYWRPGRGYLRNKGIIGRYKVALTQEQQEICRKRLNKCLNFMGYYD